MTGRILRSTVVLRDPASDSPVALLAGQECPDWAEPLIANQDVLTPPEKPRPTAKRVTRTKK